MTLATILTIYVLFSAASGDLISSRWSAASAWARPAGQQTSAPAPPNPAVSGQGAASSSQIAPASPATTTPSVSPPAQVPGGPPKTRAAKRKGHSKKKGDSPANCPPAASNTSGVEGTANSDAPSPGTSNPNQVPSGTPGTAKCPPEKKIVHDGGSTEPPIQLLGGPGGAQASHQRDTTDQLLGSVENNLKQVSGRQLSTAQQEMVNQIQQFIQQSKAAVAAGDMERGHNLAMKAHLLSDELVKP